MICILTLNPCIDKSVFVDSLPCSKSYTVTGSSLSAGGKGNNVARVLKAFGDEYISLNVIAGNNGEKIRELLAEEEILADYYVLQGESRCITTFADSHWTQQVVKEETRLADTNIDAVLNWIDSKLDDAELLCICGSVPNAQFQSVPAMVIKFAHFKGIPVVLDINGPSLSKGLAAVPEYCKPNLEEATEIFGPGEASILKKLISFGIPHPIVSLGENGAISFDGEDGLWVVPPEINAVNTVGSGDSFVAGLAHSIIRGCSFADSLLFATLCGCANATMWPAAKIVPEDLKPLYGLAKLQKFSLDAPPSFIK